MPNATISVRNTETGFVRESKSNESGNYVVTDLPIGKYELSTQVSGFKKYVLTGVVLTVDAKININIKLEVGAVGDTITVAADAVQVEGSNGEVGRLITGEEATQIQLNGRNFPQLLQLLPGVSTTFSSGFGLFGGYGVTNAHSRSTAAAPIPSAGIWTALITRTTAAAAITS